MSRRMGMGWNVCLLTAGAIGGWKMKDKWEDMTRPVKAVMPASVLATVSQVWHSISSSGFFSDDDEKKKEGGGGDRRRLRELEEKFARREEENKREMQKLLAAVEDMRNGPSYQHEFPPVLPQAPPPTRRP